MNTGPQAATMRRISEMTETRFDGVAKPYVPPQKLSISDKLTLHRDWETQIDPVTYEVIRHNLWNINEGARRHHPAHLRLAGGDLRARPQPLDPHRGRRVRLFRPLHAVHVRRYRHAG